MNAYKSVIRLFLFLLMVCAQAPALAQSFAQFKTINQKDGLSNDFVRCIFEDHNGFIWIGTENGLNRYDGYQVSVFKNDPTLVGSIQGNWINCIYEDRKDNLWIGTDKGLNLLNPGSSEFEQVHLDTDPSSSNIYQVVSIQEDRQGNLWIGTNRNGVKCLHQVNGIWQLKNVLIKSSQSSSLAAEQVAALLIDGNDNLWITSQSGIHRYHIPDGKLETLNPNTPIPIPAQLDNFDMLTIDQNGKIIVGTGLDGIYRIEQPKSIPLNNEYKHFLHEPQNPKSFSQKKIRDICPIDKDWMWIATKDGLYKTNLSTGETISQKHHPFRKNSLSSDRVEELLLDSNGNLWIGTLGGGLNLLPNQQSPFQHYAHQPSDPSSISNNQVRSMVMDDDGFLWVGTLGGGLDKMKFDPARGWLKIQNFQQDLTNSDGLSSNDIVHIIKAESGNLWITANEGKLVELNPGNSRIRSFEQQQGNAFDYSGIWALCQDKKGNIWMGTRSRGVHRLNPLTGELKSFLSDPLWSATISNKFIYHIYEDHLGQLWFCTEKGLYLFNPDNNRIQEFLHDPKNPNSISDSWVWTIGADSKNNIWIGTNYGLNKYDIKTGKFHRFYEQDGLPSNIVWGMLEEDGGHLWISTDAGLARHIDRTKEEVANRTEKSFRPYTYQSGLFGDAFVPHAYFKNEKNGQLFFGGLHGFNILNTKQISPDTSQPQMALSTLSVSGQSKDSGQKVVDYFIGGKQKIQLSYLDDILTFTFSDLHFQGYDKNKFKYRLLGLSEQWIPLEDDKTMTFIDLKPGNYTLNMRGSTPDGMLIEEKKLLEIGVQPPWWKSGWAYTIYLLGFVGLLWLAYRFQLKRQLEKQESQRLKELDQAKSRLYTNITHEFRTPLTVISGIANQMKGDSSDKELIKRNSDQLLNLVNQMLDLRKLESGIITIQKKQGDIVKFIRYLTESLKSFAELKELSIHFLSDEKELMMDYDAEKITRIHSNLLSNAIKFTDEGGDIYVQLSIDGKEFDRNVVMKIRDSGAGISEDNLPHIFDRFYQIDDSSTRKGEGSGIGLTLVSELVKAMDGEIKVKSTLGEGTTFTLALPITNASVLEDDNAFKKVSNTGLVDIASTSKGSTILWVEKENIADSNPVALIVEDNADVIHYLITCLKDHYTIEIAMNGQEGIEKGIEHIPDIIISDVMMPIKDGFELCQTLKSDERTSHIPIVLLTAKADLESRLEGIQKGADAYLSKPFHQEELLTILQSQLTLRKNLQARFSQFDNPNLIKEATVLIAQNEIEINPKVEDAFLQRIRGLVEKDLSDADFGTPQLIRGLGMSRSQIYKKVKALTGHSPSIYIRSIRLYHAQKLLKTTDLNVSEVCYEVGFSSPAYFSKLFLEEFGIQPREIRK